MMTRNQTATPLATFDSKSQSQLESGDGPLEKGYRPDVASTSFNLGIILSSFPTIWQPHILKASQQWMRYIALLQPFEQKAIQLEKVKSLVNKIVIAEKETDGIGLSHGTSAYWPPL
jgi:hypothetical protein